jgi:hypothetical protein
MEQSSPFGGVLEMSHREEPRSGRGCFGAVVVVPFLALGGMFALIAFTGSESEAPLAAPPAVRPTSQWWTEPFETAVTLSTVTETVVVQGAAREALAARTATATSTRVVGATVTETVRVSSGKPAAVGRNEPPAEEEPGTESPVVTTTSSAPVSSVEPGPPASSGEAPVTTLPSPADPPAEVPPSTPRAEEPGVTPPVTTPEVPCDRSLPPGGEEGVGGDESVGGVEEASPVEDLSTSSAPSAGV